MNGRDFLYFKYNLWLEGQMSRLSNFKRMPIQ